MRIKLNGFMALNEDEFYFDDLDIEIDENIEVPFDDIDEDYSEECADDCDGDCYDCEYGEDDLDCENNYSDDCDDCGFCDEDKEDEYDLFSDERYRMFKNTPYGVMLTDFVRDIKDTDGCPCCIAEIFDNFYDMIAERLSE